MGAWGAIILGFFGAVFAAVTLAWQYHLAGLVLATPFAVSAAIALAAGYVLRLPGAGTILPERVGRVIMWSSIGEGVGIFIAANVVQNVHRPDLLLPAMALVVGLHFLPIAAAARFRPFYVLGGALTLAAVAGAAAVPPLGGAIAGFAAGTALWIAALLAIRRDWRATIMVV